MISFGDDPEDIKHNGRLPGVLYAIAEPVGPEDVTYLREGMALIRLLSIHTIFVARFQTSRLCRGVFFALPFSGSGPIRHVLFT